MDITALIQNKNDPHRNHVFSHFIADFYFLKISGFSFIFPHPFSICRIFKAAKSTLGPSGASLQLAKGEIVLDMDGGNPVLPVFKHVGISAWPGELLETSLHMSHLFMLTLLHWQ